MAASAKLLFPEVSSVLKPPLKWAGGKRWLVPELRAVWQPYQKQRLVEPFVGGMAVTLGLAPRIALLNDINEHLINFYTWLQKGLHVNIDLRNSSTLYYKYRDRFNQLASQGLANSQEAAILFYYLNRTGYNGLCRFNQRGEFNVPFGRYKTITYMTSFYMYAETLQNWEFSKGDFEKIRLLKTDFVYADPPYDVDFTSYSREGFSWEDQVRLATWLSKHQGPVVASNQATPRIVDLYCQHGFDCEILDAPRRIACNGDRAAVRELLAFRNV